MSSLRDRLVCKKEWRSVRYGISEWQVLDGLIGMIEISWNHKDRTDALRSLTLKRQTCSYTEKSCGYWIELARSLLGYGRKVRYLFLIKIRWKGVYCNR